MKQRNLYIALLVLLFSTTLLFAQFPGTDCKKFFKTNKESSLTVYAILTGNEAFDKEYKECFKKYWTISKYEFKSIDFMATNAGTKDMYFINSWPDQYNKDHLEGLKLFSTEIAQSNVYTYTASQVYFDNEGGEIDMLSIQYRLKNVVQILNDAIDVGVEHGPGTQALKYYKKKSKEITINKNLLLCEADYEKDYLAEIKDSYKNLKLVTKKQIGETIKKGSEEVYYIMHENDGTTDNFYLISTKTGEIQWWWYNVSFKVVTPEQKTKNLISYLKYLTKNIK